MHLDYHLLGTIKMRMTDKWYAADANIKQAVTCWSQTADTKFFHGKLKPWSPQWDKYLNSNGDYVEVWCVPSAGYVPYM